jgi:hypothetical protein
MFRSTLPLFLFLVFTTSCATSNYTFRPLRDHSEQLEGPALAPVEFPYRWPEKSPMNKSAVLTGWQGFASSKTFVLRFVLENRGTTPWKFDSTGQLVLFSQEGQDYQLHSTWAGGSEALSTAVTQPELHILEVSPGQSKVVDLTFDLPEAVSATRFQEAGKAGELARFVLLGKLTILAPVVTTVPKKEQEHRKKKSSAQEVNTLTSNPPQEYSIAFGKSFIQTKKRPTELTSNHALMRDFHEMRIREAAGKVPPIAPGGPQAAPSVPSSH